MSIEKSLIEIWNKHLSNPFSHSSLNGCCTIPLVAVNILLFHFHGQSIFPVRILQALLLGIQEIIVLNNTIAFNIEYNQNFIEKYQNEIQ